MVAILKFVLVHVFGPAAGDAGGARELMGRLGGRCAARLCQAIIRTHLYPAIPDTGHGLAAFYRELEEVRKFESRLADLGFLPSTKEEGEGQQQQQQQRDAQVEAMLGLAQLQLLSPDGRRPFTAFARDANMYYAIRRRDRAFSKMRELIEAGDFAEHVVGGDGTGKEGERLTEEWVLEALRRCVEDDKPVPKLLVAISSLATAAGQQPATVFPHCVVSQCAYEVAAHAYALLSEAFRLGGGAARTQLVLGAHALFDLFRVMRPAYHEAAFRKMPALAMTFFNDCLYLAHHSQLMAAVCEQLPPPRSGEAGARWTRTAVQLQHLAEVTLEAVLELEARTVIGLVPRLDGPSPGTEADCKRAALAVRQFASIIQ
ncbi:Centromere/kinetochore protein zw10, partial [Spiromyces aspiralis]